MRRFWFPPQEYKFKRGDTGVDPVTDRNWPVVGVDDEHGTIDLKVGRGYSGLLPAALVERGSVDAKVLARAFSRWATGLCGRE